METGLCEILALDKPNPHALRLTLEAESMAPHFRPGQFAHVKCGAERLLRRPISVCSCQHDRLTLIFEVRGSGTDWLAHRRVGDKLDVLGLLGNGFSIEPSGRYLLVGGGIGVPPLLGCAQSALGRCDAVLGFRDSAHALLTDDFSSLCDTIIITTEDGSLGEAGFVTAPVGRLLAEHTYAALLCCGPRPMLKAVAALAERFGVPCQVSLEERMACGVGACLGCAVAMKDGSIRHVCKDGPVFNAGEVEWNG